MHATDILSSEHRVIEQVLGCLEKLIEEGRERRAMDWTAAEQMLDFFRHFADHCHHAKEERHLFPMLEARGFSPDFGPTGVMRYEHELGRRYIAAMAEAVAVGLRGDAGKFGQFMANAVAYARMLREHISKEDLCLFPRAGRTLSERDDQSLVHAFEETEHAPGMAGEHRKYLDLADALAERFGVPRAEAVHAGGCCHAKA